MSIWNSPATATSEGHTRRRRHGIERRAQFAHELLEPGRCAKKEHTR
jgi:hypothetical protein